MCGVKNGNGPFHSPNYDYFVCNIMIKMCWLASIDQLPLNQSPKLWDVSGLKAGSSHWHLSLIWNLHSTRILMRGVLLSLLYFVDVCSG